MFWLCTAFGVFGRQEHHPCLLNHDGPTAGAGYLVAPCLQAPDLQKLGAESRSPPRVPSLDGDMQRRQQRGHHLRRQLVGVRELGPHPLRGKGGDLPGPLLPHPPALGQLPHGATPAKSTGQHQFDHLDHPGLGEGLGRACA